MRWIASVGFTLGLAACARAAPVPLANVDADRMAGGWYILATLPNSFERGIVAPHDVYTLRPKGGVREDFYFRRGGFGGRLKHADTTISIRRNTGNADWRVHIGPLAMPFQVLWVDPDYRYALFGEQNRKLGWIYGRTPAISDAAYVALLGHFQALGYDSSKFRKFIQTPAQIGQPGFWSDGVKPAAR
jgi:apolipoprotein D and lipocalin family protein